MQHLSYDTKTIEEKLKLMTHYDVDQQFMAAADLSETIERFHQKISQDYVSRIINALLEHLKNESIDLHGNAIKCLSKIISKLPIQESKRVCEIMINNIISPDTNTEVRDIYGTCVKTIIHDVGLSFGQHIKDLLKLAIQALLNHKKERSFTIDQELVDIITPFMKKWPKEVQEIELPRAEFIKYLLRNILIGKQPILRKRSYICLGVFSANLTPSEFQLVLLDVEYGLLRHFSLNGDYEKKKIMIHSILAIVKSGNPNLQSLSNQLVAELIKNITGLKSIDDLSKCQKIYELLESSIQCIVNIVKISPQLFEPPSIYSEEIYSLCSELIEYSPYGDIQKVVDMVDQEDEFEDEDTQDSSWKVRKSVIQLIVEIGSIDEEMFKKYVKIPGLFDRFQQNQPQIIQSLISGFYTLFCSYTKQSIETHDNTVLQVQSLKLSKRESLVSVVSTLLEILIKHLNKIMNNTNFHENIIISAARLFNLIGKLFTNEIINSQQLVGTYLQVAHNILNRTKYNEVKIELFNFYQSILRSIRTPVDFIPLADTFMKCGNHHIYKVCSSAFKAIHALLSTGQMVWSDGLGTLILERLKQTDIDQEIKNSIIGCVSEILNKYPLLTPIHYIEQYLLQLSRKLTSEIEKRHTISAICKINTSLPLNPNIIETLNNIVLGISKIGLNISDNVIRIKSCQAINTLLIILGKNTQRETIERVLECSREIFKDRTFPHYLTEIMKISPESTINYLEDIINLNELPADSVRHLLGSLNVDKLLGIVQNQLSGENIHNVLTIISIYNMDIQLLNGLKESKFKEQLIVGYLGSKVDPSNFDLFLQIVLDESKDQQLRLESCRALGTLSALDVERHLPALLHLIDIKTEKYYLINSLKYLIINSTEKDEKSLLSLSQLLFKIKFSNESTQIAIAECIGLIVNKYLVSSLNNILSNLQSEDQNVRFLASSSFRYFTNVPHSETETLSKYIEGLLGLLNDQSILVRSAFVKSLNIIAFYSSNVFYPFLTETFFSNFNHLLEFREDLVEIVNYGSSKEKIDRGKIIRIDGFTFFETLLDKVTLTHGQIDAIIKGCLGTIETDTSVDVVLSRLQLLKRILNINIKLYKQSEVETARRLGVTEGKLKQYREKTEITDSKVDKVVTTILFILLKIQKNTGRDQVKFQFEKVKVVPLYKDKIKHIRL